MKIVFLAPFGIRPKGTVLARMIPLAVELQPLGHEIVIIAPPYTNPEDSGREELIQGIRLRNIRLESGFGAAPLVLAWRMFRLALAEQPDLVHLFKPKGYGGLAGMLLILLRSIGLRLPPLMVDSDDWEGRGGMNDILPYSRAERWVFAFQESWLLRRAAAVSVASRALEYKVRELQVVPENCCYLPNGVGQVPSADGGIIRRHFGISASTPVLLLYTRYFEFSQSRLYDLIELLVKQMPDCRVLVVGKGRKGEEGLLLAVARDRGFESALIMAGWIEPPDIPSYLAAADLAVYLMDDTLVNRTKCPAKLTEILAAGLPVVADAVGQVPEYIVDGRGGVLCAPGDDMTEMADQVVRLFSDPARRQAMGRAAREHICSLFAWAGLAAGLEHYYRKLTV